MDKQATITKRQLVEEIAKRAGLTGKKTHEVIQLFLDSITSYLLEGHRVEFRNFGIFEPLVRQAKKGRDLHNDCPVEIPSYTTVKFTPGKKMDARLRKGTRSRR